MEPINFKIENLFNKRVINDMRLNDKLSEFEMTFIKKLLQYAYDMGHADGYAELFFKEK